MSIIFDKEKLYDDFQNYKLRYINSQFPTYNIPNVGRFSLCDRMVKKTKESQNISIEEMIKKIDVTIEESLIYKEIIKDNHIW